MVVGSCSQCYCLILAAIAAYNMGFRNMSRNYNNIDDHTTGGDYSDDVVARAQYLNVMVINICPQKKISYIPCAVVVYSNI